MQGLITFGQSPGTDGFLGTRGSFMMDFVVCAMFAVVPVMLWSVFQVKYRRKFLLHKRMQLGLASVLFVAIIGFEVDVRVNGWVERAGLSPYWIDGRGNDWIDYSLMVHLFFAIPTVVLWFVVILRALRRFPNPPEPNDYSRSHKFWARLAAFEMTMTAITGVCFYWFAFVAS